MECGIPFCHNGCPLGNLIPDWIDLAYGDDVVTAFLLLVERDDLPPESARDPSLFDFEAARAKLAQARPAEAGAELERVLGAVQHAVGE